MNGPCHSLRRLRRLEAGDWGSAPDPEVYCLRAKPEERERRAAAAARPSVSAPGSALELLFSSALSSDRVMSNLGQRVGRNQLRRAAEATMGGAWSCLGELGSPSEMAPAAAPDGTPTAPPDSRGGVSERTPTRVTTTTPVPGASYPQSAVPFGRANHGPAWAGLDNYGSQAPRQQFARAR